MNRIRLFINMDDTPQMIVRELMRLYPRMKKQHGKVEIHMTFDRNYYVEKVRELYQSIKSAKILDSLDRIYHDFI